MLIVFGLGSNLGNKKSNILKAVYLLKKSLPFNSFLSFSSLLKTDPLVIDGSPPVFSRLTYINAAVAFDLSCSPLAIFKKIKKIEARMGRKKCEKWAPRKIDIDILIYEGMDVNLPNLHIPHLDLLYRNFALIPLIEVLSKAGYNKAADRYLDALKKLNIANQLQNLPLIILKPEFSVNVI